MKKTVIIILAILPIFLLLTISFAGKILSLYSFISVEDVYYVSDKKEELPDEFMVEINKGDTYQTYIRVLPELATDKEVTYVSSNENACVVDKNGLITGMGYGTSYVNVITNDSKKIDTLVVNVTDNYVSGVELSAETLEIVVGETKRLKANINPQTAINKNVKWASSDSSVLKVDSNGYITALSKGTAEVFVITEDGHFTDVCLVTCVEGLPALSIDFSESDFIIKIGEGYQSLSNEVDLKEYLIINPEKVSPEDVTILLESGIEYATLDENLVLTFEEHGKIVSLLAYVGDKEDPAYLTRVLILYK